MADEKKNAPEEEEEWVAFIEFVFEAPDEVAEIKEGDTPKLVAERAVEAGLKPLLKRLPNHLKWEIELVGEGCTCAARREGEEKHSDAAQCDQHLTVTAPATEPAVDGE